MDAQQFLTVLPAAVVAFMLGAFLIKRIDKNRPIGQKLFGRFYSE